MGSVDINSNFAMTWPWWSTGVHTGSGFPHVICTACHLGFSVKEFIDVGSQFAPPMQLRVMPRCFAGSSWL